MYNSVLPLHHLKINLYTQVQIPDFIPMLRVCNYVLLLLEYRLSYCCSCFNIYCRLLQNVSEA